MQTMQQSWRHSLAGMILLAILAPANNATPAEAPPSAPPAKAADGQEAYSRSEQQAKTTRAIEEKLQDITETLDRLNASRTQLRRALTPDAFVHREKEIEDQIAKLEAQKRELTEKLRDLQSKHIRVFRLKHIKPEEARQALENLLDASTPPRERPRTPGAGAPGVYPPGVSGMPPPAMAPMREWRLSIDERTQAIIMLASTADLQRAADILALLDQPGGKPLPQIKGLRVFKLRFAQAEKIANILGQLNVNTPVLPMQQSNRLIVAGDDFALKEITKLIEELDVETNGSK